MWDWLRTAAKARWREKRQPRSPEPVRLPAGGLWSARVLGCPVLTLTCAEGSLWLTCEGDFRDHVLHPGDSIRLEGAGHVVVQALRPSRFCLRERPASHAASVAREPGPAATAQ